MHYFACGWLWLTDEKKLEGLAYVDWSEDTMAAKYVDSVYLVTTTITTVGYGDFKAYNSEDPDWAIEMVYLYVVTLAGITLFSIVTNQIFTYRKLLTAGELINNRVKDIEAFMYQVSLLRKDLSFTEEMFD